ncbi:hypothetical protein Pmani_004173 [Petrolisthes manimaculis]|uniref:Uncharacterized protein n=1 Tax=Petrolisthes manimaculis TaxID=1843537 RepID=A0AAE1QH02_9EUCA|nr:hypothetical protein Pmani_004173 [Petrolisthes manimaculis]
MRIAERLTERTHTLSQHVVGDCVCIQNQTGPNPTKWDKTEIVIEVRQFDQYIVRVDGLGCVTLRNRKFLHKYMPVIPRAPLAMASGPTAIVLAQVNLPTSITPQLDSSPPPTTPIGPPKTPPWVYQASLPDPTNPLPDKPAAPQASLSPTVPQPDQSLQPTAAHEPTKSKPRALHNLMPHNAPCLKEWPTVDPTMSPLSTPSPGSPAPLIRCSTQQTRPPAMMN